MSGGGKGGSQTSEASIPKWAADPTIRNLARTERAQQLGYQPYIGPDLAAFTPTQQAGMQNVVNTAADFGLATPSDPMAGMPRATDFGGGISGYSAYPIFDQALEELRQRDPEQQAIYDSLFGNIRAGGGQPIRRTV